MSHAVYVIANGWVRMHVPGGGEGGGIGLIFAGDVPLASWSPYQIIVYSVANYRPHLGHFWTNM